MEAFDERPDYLRQMDIISPKDLAGVSVVMIGAGGIGSFTTAALAKMGVVDITVYDDDSVEPHNLPNQFYRLRDLRVSKVEAIASICDDFTGAKINTVADRLGDARPEGIVISGVDSMASRKAIWENVAWNINVPRYIDARMGAQILQIFTIDPCEQEQIDFYEKSLFDDANAYNAPCTNRAIIYTALVVAGFICGQVRKIVTGEEVAKEIIFDCRNISLTKR